MRSDDALLDSEPSFQRYSDSCYRRHGGLTTALLLRSLDRPVTRRLVVEQVGYYVNEHGHCEERPRGAGVAIVIVCVAGTGGS